MRKSGGKANWLQPLLPFSIIHAGLGRQKIRVQHLLVCHLSAGQRALDLDGCEVSLVFLLNHQVSVLWESPQASGLLLIYWPQEKVSLAGEMD